LIETVEYWNQPLDDPLRWWLTDPRRMERKIEDSLWIRPVDVLAALNGRRYACAGSVSLRMQDELCPWNTGVNRLEVDESGTGTCQRFDGDAKVNLTPYALGAAYLGGVRFNDLANSGFISGSADAISEIDAMFAWSQPPWCQEIF
jgi:predicted acetyltransferase